MSELKSVVFCRFTLIVFELPVQAHHFPKKREKPFSLLHRKVGFKQGQIYPVLSPQVIILLKVSVEFCVLFLVHRRKTI